MAETTNNKVYWVKGNTQPFIIPLEQEVMTGQDEIVSEPYYPDENADIVVNFVGKWMRYPHKPIVDGNLLIFTVNATMPAGNYDIEVVVKNQDGTQHRSQWDKQVVITNSNTSVLQEWNEFKQQAITARAALFFFAKGDKGDAFTYEDFTQEQIEGLKKPAYDAAQELTQEVHVLEQQFTQQEDERIANENTRKENELERQSAESSRELKSKEDHAQAVSDHTQYEQDHTKELQRQSNESQRQQSETIREQAETSRNTNESNRQQAETQREETFATYKPIIDKKLDMITQEQFNQIFA